MTAPTTAGRDTKTAWLAGVPLTVALARSDMARSDMARWEGGWIMRSLAVTRYQDGASPLHLSELLERQARRTTMTARHLPETRPSTDGTPLPGRGRLPVDA